jgi:hypothetical protein
VRDELRALYWGGGGDGSGASTEKEEEEAEGGKNEVKQKNPLPARHEECEVAVHIRRGDAAAIPKRFTPNDVVRRALETHFASSSYDDEKEEEEDDDDNDESGQCRSGALVVCIFSEGKEEDFELGDLSQSSGIDIRYHLDESVLGTFHNLVTAPELVIAKSSFSYAAALLSTGKVYYLDEFWHAPLDDWTHLTGSSSRIQRRRICGESRRLSPQHEWPALTALRSKASLPDSAAAAAATTTLSAGTRPKAGSNGVEITPLPAESVTWRHPPRKQMTSGGNHAIQFGTQVRFRDWSRGIGGFHVSLPATLEAAELALVHVCPQLELDLDACEELVEAVAKAALS